MSVVKKIDIRKCVLHFACDGFYVLDNLEWIDIRLDLNSLGLWPAQNSFPQGLSGVTESGKSLSIVVGLRRCCSLRTISGNAWNHLKSSGGQMH